MTLLFPNSNLAEAVCIASGPSLTISDCDAVRSWRDAEECRFVVVTNNTFKICPWADALYAMDNEWWRQYGKRVSDEFGGVTFSRYGEYGTRKVSIHGSNSGAGAILLAAEIGAKRIVLLGYDCQQSGKKHWHQDHKHPLGNCESMPHWEKHFQFVADHVEVPIVNASRETALDCFPLRRLEDELFNTV